MALIKYNTESDPTETGIYACRVESDILPWPFADDKFLIWIEGKWGYCGSDLAYRGQVYGWIGPLQRMMDR